VFMKGWFCFCLGVDWGTPRMVMMFRVALGFASC